MHPRRLAFFSTLFVCWSAIAQRQGPAPKALIEVRANQVRSVSRLLTGACIEDVNHEIYGGLYSQMIFGESFQEPPAPPRLQGFRVLGGKWQVRQGEVNVTGKPGDKIVSELHAFRNGEVGVEVFVPDRKLTNAGLIVRVNRAEVGADNFDGYEIALNATDQKVLLGRHRQNFTLLKTAPCVVPTGQWVPLAAKLTGSVIEIFVNGKSDLRYDDGDSALPAGAVGLRQWQREARYRNLWIKTGDKTQSLPFQPDSNETLEVSGLWRPAQAGNAKGSFALRTDRPFVVEPFGGAASVLLNKPPSVIEVYNDLDHRLTRLFRVLRDHGTELQRRLALTPYSEIEFQAANEPATNDEIEQTRRDFVRWRLSLGGRGDSFSLGVMGRQ